MEIDTRTTCVESGLWMKKMLILSDFHRKQNPEDSQVEWYARSDIVSWRPWSKSRAHGRWVQSFGRRMRVLATIRRKKNLCLCSVYKTDGVISTARPFSGNP